MFGTILLTVFTLMHVYVFWRITSIPMITARITRKKVIGVGVILWIAFYLGRFMEDELGSLGGVFELIGMNWLAATFLICLPLLLSDLITLFGLILPRLSVKLRTVALSVGLALSVVALIQGFRPPVITNYEVKLPNLPEAENDIVMIALSDMHLGSLLGENWLKQRIAQVNEQQPDIVVLLGDIFEGHGTAEDQLVDAFKQLTAPLGVWAVAGNHEHHRGGGVQLFEEAGFRLLLNEWVEVIPGIILAGVDDLTSSRRRGQNENFIQQTLADRPLGDVILLSHSPLQTASAAEHGVRLMLSGHTHGGQIWPFDYLVKNRYPLLEGLYKEGDMSVIVSRGTGTWGPRMRLWRPGEILRVTLLSEKK